jgi:hypothetical protein
MWRAFMSEMSPMDDLALLLEYDRYVVILASDGSLWSWGGQ